MNPEDLVRDHRARMEVARLEARERRETELKAQRSSDTSPADRVAIWERVHQVRMPSDPGHQILRLIAQQTLLDLADVLAVQRARVPA